MNCSITYFPDFMKLYNTEFVITSYLWLVCWHNNISQSNLQNTPLNQQSSCCSKFSIPIGQFCNYLDHVAIVRSTNLFWHLLTPRIGFVISRGTFNVGCVTFGLKPGPANGLLRCSITIITIIITFLKLSKSILRKQKQNNKYVELYSYFVT